MWIEILIIAILAIWAIFAVRGILRRRKKGGCCSGGCSDCSCCPSRGSCNKDK